MPPPIPSNEADGLPALHDFALNDTPPDPALDRLARRAAALLGAPLALISLIDEKRQWLGSRTGATLTEIPHEPAFCADAIMREDILVIHAGTHDARFRRNPLAVDPGHVWFCAGTAEGLAIGTLSVMDRTLRGGISAKQTQALRDLAALSTAPVEAPQPVGELL